MLARLQVAAPDLWLLKGGVALDYRFQDQARTTFDIDLTVRARIDEMTQALRDAARVSMDDYFQVRVGEREKPIDEVETSRFNVSYTTLMASRFHKISRSTSALLTHGWVSPND